MATCGAWERKRDGGSTREGELTAGCIGGGEQRQKEAGRKKKWKKPLHCRHFGAQRISSLTHDVFPIPHPLTSFSFSHAFSLHCLPQPRATQHTPPSQAPRHTPYMHASPARLFCPYFLTSSLLPPRDLGGPAAVAPAFAAFPDRCRNSTKNSKFNWPRPLVTSGRFPLLLTLSTSLFRLK